MAASALSAARRSAVRSKASPTLAEPLSTAAPTPRFTGSGSPVSVDWSSTATPEATTPSTGATSPRRISRRSPGRMVSSVTSSKPPSRWRMALRGARARSAVISRCARASAKFSRYWPLAYMSATTAAARCSPKVSAAVIDRAATMSRPTSPRRRLVTISHKRPASTGRVPATHSRGGQTTAPAAMAARPPARPRTANASCTWRSEMRGNGSGITVPATMNQRPSTCPAHAVGFALTSVGLSRTGQDWSAEPRPACGGAGQYRTRAGQLSRP